MNGIQVTNFLNRSTEPLNNYRIYARPQTTKQARRPEFYKHIDKIIESCSFEWLHKIAPSQVRASFHCDKLRISCSLFEKRMNYLFDERNLKFNMFDIVDS